MSESSFSKRYIYSLIISGLIFWALFHALGASYANGNNNPLRGVVVLVSFALFIAFWLLLLRTLRPRSDSKRE